MARAEVAVEITDLAVSYGSTHALGGLSFEVPAGQITALLGPNGAGKTTTIEVCEGYLSPDSGSVRVWGLDPVRDCAALRPRVGVMLQDGGIYSSIRAVPMLRHLASFYANPLDVDDLVARLGLGGVRATYRRMSGGEKQRLALACAVVGRPDLVFLDEPSAGMDPQTRLAAWDLVEQLRADGVTVVLTTHLIDEAERLADQVVIIDHGRLVTARRASWWAEVGSCPSPRPRGSTLSRCALGSPRALWFLRALRVTIAWRVKSALRCSRRWDLGPMRSGCPRGISPLGAAASRMSSLI